MEAGRDLELRNLVISVGAIAGIVFALLEFTGSEIDEQAGQTLYTAFALVLFTIIGSTGVALAHLQPRFSLFAAVTTILSPLAFGATVVSLWSNGPFIFGFGFSGTSGTVGGITVILTITAAAICVLLATVRPGEDGATRSVRVVGIGALALLVALSILSILVDSVDIGSRVYAIVATVYVIATVVSLLLRLLPIDGRSGRLDPGRGVVT
jgi:hypothetical protein